MNATWSRHQRFWLPAFTLAFGVQTYVLERYGGEAFTLAQAITLAVIAGGSCISTVYAAFVEPVKRIGVALGFIWFTCVVLIRAFAEIYLRTGLMEGEHRVSDVGTATYFSVVTWTTLGYGDIRPVGASRFLAGLEGILGYVYVGLFVVVLVRSMQSPAP